MQCSALAIYVANLNDLIYMTNKTVYPTTWIVDLQEDPETGDLIMEIPPDLLAAQRWGEGTVLTWGQTENGDWSLTKAD